MRSKRALMNISGTLLVQFVTLICGLIVPKLVITAFGSAANGLVQSISQFLSYISLLEAGVGGVARAALYKPLANGDSVKLAGVIKAAENFFRKIAYIFIVYIFVLAVLYPQFVQSDFSWLYSSSMVLILGIGTVAQYYFGVTYQMLVTADQKGYIYSTINIISIILNAIFTVALIKLGASLHMVKLASAVAFVIRPLILNIYVRKKYTLDKRVSPDSMALKQKWDGMGQHFAFFVHGNTDVVVLTILANVKYVSVYTAHLMVISGIKNVINSLSAGFSPALGDMIARKEHDLLNSAIDIYEFVAFYLVSIFFTITAIMITPFMSVYMKDVTDISYIRPMFAYLMCLAEGLYVIRSVYSTVVVSAGHYRQTSKGAYIEAGINVILSVILVKHYGLIGVAIGTVVATGYRTIDFILYLSKNIAYRSISKCLKSAISSVFGIIIATIIINKFIVIHCLSWWDWIYSSIGVSIIVFLSVSIVSIMVNKSVINSVITKIKQIL